MQIRYTSADAKFGPPETAFPRYSLEHPLLMVDGNKQGNGNYEHVVQYLQAR
jgi:hypothetical protein